MRRLDKNLTISLLHFAGAAAISLCWLFLSGCAVDVAKQRQILGSEFNRVLAELPKMSGTKTIVIDRLVIHLVGDSGYYDYEPYRDPARGVLGYTRLAEHEIWCYGYMHKGRVMPSHTVLGWELNNLLHYLDCEITDPEEDL